MEDVLLAEARLENINAVEPILSALRTVSHGTWQKAQLKVRAVQDYAGRIERMTDAVLFSWSGRRQRSALRDPVASRRGNRVLVLAMGSERGLCGQFNTMVFRSLQDLRQEQAAQEAELEIWALGTRCGRLMPREGLIPAWSVSYGSGGLPPFDLAVDLSRRLLQAYEEYRADEILVLHNSSSGAGRLQLSLVRLIPPEGLTRPDRMTRLDPGQNKPDGSTPERGELPWPPPILDADPLQLLVRLVEHRMAIRLYEYLLISAAAENATRFFLMEDATQNVERLVEELEILVQLDRQAAITREMGELAVGAGMLKVE